MNDLKLIFYHPSLNLLSDRTFRGLLKKFSAIAREIQTQEAFYLVNQSFLSLSEKQSIRDRLKPSIPHISAYYVERIEKGSLEVAVGLTAAALWLLQITLGESVKEAWKKSRWHKELIEYLSSERRRTLIEQKVDSVIGNLTADRFLFEIVSKEIDSEGNIVVRVVLRTPVELEQRIEEVEVIDVDYVVRSTKRELAVLEKAQDDSKPHGDS